MISLSPFQSSTALLPPYGPGFPQKLPSAMPGWSTGLPTSGQKTTPRAVAQPKTSGVVKQVSAATSQQAASQGEDARKKEGKRTKGLWLFDTLLYPVLTNSAVFAISVLATYATTHGPKGNIMRQRGDAAREWLQKRFHMSEDTAKETGMIAFSFLDGSLMAPVVKWFEDNRMDVVRTFDRWMGGKPEDSQAYDKEPKQSWGSVLGGRAAAFALVVPTAKLLSMKMGGANSFNDKLFAQPGKKLGQWLEPKLQTMGQRIVQQYPKMKDKLPKLNIPGLMEVCFMEGFYTALCTTSLYLSSRFLAKHRQSSSNNQPPSNNQSSGMRPAGAWIG